VTFSIGAFALTLGVTVRRSIIARFGAPLLRPQPQLEPNAVAGRFRMPAPSIALSADGNIVLLGEPEDNGGLGAALVFTRPGAGDY
jgi:hypothetical protein